MQPSRKNAALTFPSQKETPDTVFEKRKDRTLKYLPIVLITLGALILLALITAAALFLKIFYAVRKKPKNLADFPLPEGEVYAPHHEQMIQWIKEIRAMDRKSVSRHVL